jgi:hypothetical protein
MAVYKKEDINVSKVSEPEYFIKTFSSQEEAELYNLKENLAKSDMEKFQLFCRMMRIGKMLSSAKISDK